MDRIISFIFGLIFLTWIIGFAIGINLFTVISEHGVKSVAICVWEGKDACDNLDVDNVEVEQADVSEKDRNSHIK